VPLSGLSSLTGYREHPPMHVGVSYGDPTAGLHGAVAVLAALLHRARTGAGQYIDLSQWETSIAVLGDAIAGASAGLGVPTRDGNRVPHMAPHGVFRALGDDRWIALAAPDDDAWRRLAALMEEPQLAADARFANLEQRKVNEDALEALVTAWTSTRSANELTAALIADRGVVRMVASYDLNWKELAAMLGRFPAGRFEAVIHQHMPMFHMEHCVFCHTLSTTVCLPAFGRMNPKLRFATWETSMAQELPNRYTSRSGNCSNQIRRCWLTCVSN